MFRPSLGEPEKAATAKGWLVASFLMIPVYFAIGFLMADEDAADRAARGLQIAFLFVWYFSTARSQARYVKAKFGTDYPRRAWGKPLGLAFLGLIGFFVAIFVIAIAIAGLTHQ